MSSSITQSVQVVPEGSERNVLDNSPPPSQNNSLRDKTTEAVLPE